MILKKNKKGGDNKKQENPYPVGKRKEEVKSKKEYYFY